MAVYSNRCARGNHRPSNNPAIIVNPGSHNSRVNYATTGSNNSRNSNQVRPSLSNNPLRPALRVYRYNSSSNLPECPSSRERRVNFSRVSPVRSSNSARHNRPRWSLTGL